MPLPTVLMLRISLIYLLLSAVMGALLLIHKAVDVHPMMWALLPLHFEMAIWGWMVQFVLGTAYWMFPKYLSLPTRGPESTAWLMAGLYNSGVLILLISYPTTLPFGAFSGRLLLIISILLFAMLMWKRVVSYRDLH